MKNYHSNTNDACDEYHSSSFQLRHPVLGHYRVLYVTLNAMTCVIWHIYDKSSQIQVFFCEVWEKKVQIICVCHW